MSYSELNSLFMVTLYRGACSIAWEHSIFGMACIMFLGVLR